jgi:CDP-diacylglycerol--serine O-phosphatidyltransferase
MKVRTNWVPSAFTMTNLFCGYLSVILSTGGRYIQAAWLIVAAAVLDVLDGKIARFAKVDSHFGVEYDSLADVISFGFAPSMLLYKSVFINWGILGIFISVGPLVFGSIRLARFNIRLKGFNKDYFEGLPIPAAAVTMATFLVFNFHFWGFLRWEKVCLFLVIALSVLMVTSIRYETFPNFSLQSGLQNRYKFLVVIGGTLLVILFPQETFFPLSVTYVLSGPFNLTWQILRGGNNSNAEKREG